jgi:hypothetical protein
MRSDGYTDGKIAPRAAVIASTLVTAPVQEKVFHGDAAHELRTLLAIGHEKDVVALHGGTDARLDRFLAEDLRVRAELTRALKRDGFGVIGAHEHHPAVQIDEICDVRCERRQRLSGFAGFIEELGVANFERCDDAHGLFIFLTERLW